VLPFAGRQIEAHTLATSRVAHRCSAIDLHKDRKIENDEPEASVEGEFGQTHLSPRHRAFSRALGVLTELGVNVVALFVDGEETSGALIAKHKLSFPVGHNADAGKGAAVTGAYVNDDPHYLQSTGFVLVPDGTAPVAVYSSDAIRRLVADDVAGYIRYLTEHVA
jgi:hypothetical protein